MSERVLVVGAEPAIGRVYETHLTGAGFEVCLATTLTEAAERLASTSFEAIIADVSLTPELAGEGLALAAYLRCHLRQAPLPAIVLTAYGSPEFAEAASRAGADFFLHKPVSLPWLAKELRAFIQERRIPLGSGCPDARRHSPSLGIVGK